MSIRKCLLPVLFMLSSLHPAAAADPPDTFGEQVRKADAILRVVVKETQVARASEGVTSPVDSMSAKCEVVGDYKGKTETGKSVEIRCERKQPEFSLIRKDGEYVVILGKLPKGDQGSSPPVEAAYQVKDGKVTDPENKEKEITLDELQKRIRGHDNGHG